MMKDAPVQQALQSTNESQAAVRLSPDTTIRSASQNALIQTIEDFCREHMHGDRAIFVIQGEAGTGKSMVLNTAFSRIQMAARSGNPSDPLNGSKNLLLVNHPEMIKLYRNIAETQPSIRKKDYQRPTTFINQMHKLDQRADVVFIDESHLLLTRRDRYNHFHQDNQLEEIIRLSRVIVLVFDPMQVLKFKSCWDTEKLEAFLGGGTLKRVLLTDQFRVRANPDVQLWMKSFCNRKILPLPASQAFDFRIFEDAAAMYREVQAKNQEFGMSRMLATYDYPYTLDGRDHFIVEGDFRLRWDRAKPEEKLPWAERDDTIDEVGSVYTIQGFDLNYAGVILGPCVSYDEKTDRILIDSSKYEDRAAFVGKHQLEDVQSVEDQIVLNSINILMTRATSGLYLYASDPALRRKLSTLQAG